MIHQFFSKQFMLFLLTGGVAAIVNFGSRIFYSQWFSFSIAIIFAYMSGMVTAFILARLFVFETSEQSIVRSICLFCLVNTVAVAQTWIISMGMAIYVLPYMRVTAYANEIAHLLGVMLPVFTSYLGHKNYSFK